MQDKRNTESVVQEIMGWVDDVLDKREAYQDHKSSRAWCEYESARDRLESKLRELVENKSSVREPLSDYEIAKLDCVYLEEVQYSDDVEISQASVIEFARAIERAHNITQEKQG